MYQDGYSNSNSSILKFSLNSNQKDRKYNKEIKICNKNFNWIVESGKIIKLTTHIKMILK